MRLKSIDGWRAVSIVLVVIGHLVNYRYGSTLGFAPSLASYAATLGVNVFFVISGFLIARSSLTEEAETHTFSARGFYLRRLFRIVPAFAVYLLAMSTLASIGIIDQSVIGLAQAGAFSCNLPGTDCGWFANHSWSLAYEQQFYLLFPFAFVLSISARRRLILAIHLMVVAASLAIFVLPIGTREPCLFVARFSSITMGVLLAAYAHRVERFAANRKLLIAAIAVLVIAVFIGANALNLRYDVRNSITTMILPPALAWLIFCSLSASGWTQRVLNHFAAQYVGAMSYSLYLWQQAFTGPALHYANAAWLPWMLMFPAAILSYEFVEKPFMNIGRRLVKTYCAKCSPRAAVSSQAT